MAFPIVKIPIVGGGGAGGGSGTPYAGGGTGTLGGTVWAVIKVPGGARVGIGQGKGLDQTTIWTPPGAPWIGDAVSAGRMMSICSLTDAPQNNPPVTGYGINQMTGNTLEGAYLTDSSTPTLTTRGIQSVNWLAAVWESGTEIQTVGGFPFLILPLQGDHAVAIGAGQVAAGTAITLPAGYTQSQMQSFCTPAGSAASTFHFRGVQQCAFVGLTPVTTYTDNTNTWLGPTNWMVACWK